MKRLHLILGSGVILATWLAAFGDTTHDDLAQTQTQTQHAAAMRLPITVTQTAGTLTPATQAASEDPMVLALVTREQLIRHARPDGPAALFASHNWTPPPPPAKPLPAPLPTAPPVPFTYLGKLKDDGEWQVFLGQGDTTWIVRKNDLVNKLYQVVDIGPSSLTLLYLPLGQPQSLTIE